MSVFSVSVSGDVRVFCDGVLLSRDRDVILFSGSGSVGSPVAYLGVPVLTLLRKFLIRGRGC